MPQSWYQKLVYDVKALNLEQLLRILSHGFMHVIGKNSSTHLIAKKYPYVIK